MPGETVATTEEYVPGYGVAEANGEDLVATNIGELELDPEEHIAKVKARTRVARFQGPGTIVIGVVAKTTDDVAIIDLIPMKTANFAFIPTGASAILHVSNVKPGYVKSIKTEFKVGDIVRAKIIESTPLGVKLTTDGKNLGALLTNCSRCRASMARIGARVKCTSCGWVEDRKIAYDYGTGREI
ncbi:MAG: exosome complex RNA-binding protein Csl4 [DPANN group archaeon]|nr:exosome complex RNA-binding protein Csl4 [DPANN group archaeon]